jgi:hypothetical protein
MQHSQRFWTQAGRPHTVALNARRFGYGLDAAALLAALAIKLADPSPGWIERYYANGAYPGIDRAVRAVTGPLPFCVGDVLFFAALAWLSRYWFVSIRRAAGRPLGAAMRAALRTAAAAAAIFVWFVLSWAYNYSRIPLTEKIVVHESRTDEQSVAAFADRVLDELSRVAPAAHRERLDDAALGARLAPRFEATIRRLGDDSTFAPPHIKPTVFQAMMQLSATSGFTDPWTHEVNLNATAFPVERPALYAHEWAHVAGFADESEANFISAIVCTTSRDPLLVYSGWILVYFNLPSDVHFTHRISRLAYRDLVAIHERYLREANRQVAQAQRVAYDRYLKSNHVKAGYASYQLFIRLMTGADFDAEGLPLVRSRTGNGP